MEWAATPAKTRTRERSGLRAQAQSERVKPAAGPAPETSTLVSIFRCDFEMRVSEVIYSDHVADSARFIGGTDYDWLPSDEADAVLRLKRRAATEQRAVRDTLSLTFEGSRRTF